MKYYARHTKEERTVVTIQIEASSPEEASTVNDQWQIGETHDKVKEVEESSEVTSYFASDTSKNIPED